MSINKILSKLNPEASRVIKKRFSEAVVRRRSPLWFFKYDVRKGSTRDNLPSDTDEVVNGDSSTSPDIKPPPYKLSKTEIGNIWRNMDPESKRKYFNMAEFDDMRYREQKSRWIASVGTIFSNTNGDLDKVIQQAPKYRELQNEFLTSLERLHEEYDKMIQTSSVKMLYKDAIRLAENNATGVGADQLVESLPKDLRPVLNKPRRPPSPFILYMNEHLDRLQAEKKGKQRVHTLASIEWAKLPARDRKEYQDRYETMLNQYSKNMKLFKSKVHDSTCLEQASVERRAFRRSIRKRLQDSSVLPIFVRNAFNFFFRDNKHIPLSDLSGIWKRLPQEEKERYYKMTEEDTARYQDERGFYDKLTKSLGATTSNKKSSQVR